MTVRTGGFALLVALAASCSGGSNICSNNVDLATKTGDCTGVATGFVLGSASTCSMRANMCSASEQKTVSSALECLAKLPTCAAATKAEWVTQQMACNSGLQSLSQGCKDALFGGVLPGEDGGTDAGPYVDAGRQPIEDGGHGISLVAVADENNVAFAWAPLQRAGIASWELNVFNASEADGGGPRLPEVSIPGGTTSTFQELNLGPGKHRRYYIAGLDSTGNVAVGFVEDAGGPVTIPDGGCLNNYQCNTMDVCNLGTCAPQTCTMSATCPLDYICNVNVMPNTCLRTGNTGALDAGMMMTAPVVQLPMISPAVRVFTQTPTFGNQTFIGGFSARRPDMVAIDSARQFVAMEQGGAPVGHFTVARGKDFVIDSQTASVIDTVGSNVHVAYNADNQVIYACYNVGRGVRVRRSRDFGRTWGDPSQALTVQPEDDGGTESTINDCDIAPWKNGTALMVTVDDGYLVTRQVTDALTVNGAADIAFVPGPADGGGFNVFNARRPSIATLPSADIVHVGFTGSRIVAAITDQDIFGVYRDTSTGGAFSNPVFINSPGGMNGSGPPQDWVAVTIDPITRRGIAVWTTLETSGGNNVYSTVYLGFFNNQTKRWITGSDLSVFMQFGGNYPLYPMRTTGLWDAFSPQVTATRDGRIWLMWVAGERQLAGPNDILPYAVEFALDAGSPVGGQGWFKPPALKLSDTRPVDPRSGGNSVPPTNTAFAADSQISLYGVFVEGVGNVSQEENRGIFVSRP